MLKKLLLSLIVLVISSNSLMAKDKPILLFYCGITMVKPIAQISKIIEKKYNCTIKIMQGGSKDLYTSLKLAKKGDLYLPGSDSYRKKNLKDGFLLDEKYIGFNKAAIFVQKGNPKKIKDLKSMLDENIATIICNPKTGSIGKNGKSVLIKFGGEEFYDEAFDLAVEIGTDSRNLNKALIDKRADIAINWRATGFWPENSPFIDVIEIDDKYAPKKKLIINLLSFSKHPKIAKALMEFAASKDGQAIMKRYGFL
ncbi:MAG: substrate-binding domain-containing protein [Arcobacteraceae bacterium]|nr:substrate-binding domain-containing protein [Arcobacteraceae bacterium]